MPRPAGPPLLLVALLLAAVLGSAAAAKPRLTTTPDGRVVNEKGVEQRYYGVNWFGFNTDLDMPGNLTNGPDSATQDFATSVWRMRQLGFNSVRLPFRFRDLAVGEPGGPDRAPYPYTRLCGSPSPDVLKTTVGPPTFDSWLPRSRSRAGAPLRLPVEDPPEVPNPPGSGGKSLCNAPLARTRTVRDRFHYVVAELLAQGMAAVMIDYHPGVRIPGAETVLDDLPAWVDEWERTLTLLLEAVPGVRGRLLVDLINEPDAFEMTWNGAVATSPASATPLGDFYLAAIDRLHPVCPECLFLVEGGGQASIEGVHWGNGFVTDQGVLARVAPYTGGSPPGSPSAFLDAALARPWVASMVISPHIYCPAVSGAVDCYSGPCFHDSLRSSYGYLTTPPGYCPRDKSSKCRVLVSMVGELGSTLEPGKETECMQTVVDWMTGTGGARPGAVAANASWYYWAYNPDSGDVGGLLNPTDWRSVEWPRIHMLTGGVRDFPVGLGLRPWYLAGFTGGQPGKGAAAAGDDSTARAATAGRSVRRSPPPAAIALYTVLPIAATLLTAGAVYFYRTARAAAVAAAPTAATTPAATTANAAGFGFGFLSSSSSAAAAGGEGKAPPGHVFEVPAFATTPGPAIPPARLQTLAVELAVPGSGGVGAGTGRSPVSTPRSRRGRGGGGGGGGDSPHALV